MANPLPTPTPASAPARRNRWQRALRVLRHRWMDESDARHAIPLELRKRLGRYVSASEARHSGEVRICVESALPSSYIWRDATMRERAITMFGKLRVWDTEQNNGVLIYLVLADNAIEIVADRALNTKVSTQEWQKITASMAAAFKAQHFEAGLTQALEEVSALLVQHFPLAPGQQRHNELPNTPFVN